MLPLPEHPNSHLVFSGVRVAQSLQAVKIQYGQRSEPAQTKPIQNKHKHCTHNFKNQSQQTDLRKHFPGETYTTTSNTMNQSLREKHRRMSE